MPEDVITEPPNPSEVVAAAPPEPTPAPAPEAVKPAEPVAAPKPVEVTPAPAPKPPTPEDVISGDDFTKPSKPPEIIKSKGSEVKPGEPTAPPKPNAREAVLEQLGITAENRAVFKNMSNESFDYTVARIKEIQTFKQQQQDLQKQLEAATKGRVELPKSYTEHAEAFVLHPEYPKHLTGYQDAMREGQHWFQQLIRIERGEKWQDLEVKDGKLVTVEREPNAEAKMQVSEWYATAKEQAKQHESAITVLRTNHANQHQGLRMFISERADKFFPDLAQKEAREKNEYYSAMHKMLDAQGLGSNVLTDLYSRTYAFLMKTINENKALALEVNKLKGGGPKPPGALNIQPSSDDIKAGSNGRPNFESKDIKVEDLMGAFTSINKGQPVV